MTKQLLIETCEECPYVRPIQFDIACNDDTSIMYFKCSHSKFPYGKSNWVIRNQILDDCPLDNYEPSIGDLTPEDLQRINATAEAIKNAKNVRDGRYGGWL